MIDEKFLSSSYLTITTMYRPDDPDLLSVFTEDFCQDNQLGTD